MTRLLFFVTIFSLLISQAFALGPHPLLQRQASTTSRPPNLPTDVPWNFPSSCANQCTDLVDAYDNCAGASDFNTCICYQRTGNGLVDCLNCAVSNGSGSLNTSVANAYLNGYVTRCNSAGIPITSLTLKSASAPVVAVSLSLIGCMIGVVLGAGMIFV